MEKEVNLRGQERVGVHCDRQSQHTSGRCQGQVSGTLTFRCNDRESRINKVIRTNERLGMSGAHVRRARPRRV